MKKIQHKLIYSIALVFALSTMYSCHKKGPYNPYLDLKVKPHQEEGKKTKKAARKAAKAYRQQLRSNRKAVFGKKVAPK
jgi:uncharacterized protein YwgA